MDLDASRSRSRARRASCQRVTLASTDWTCRLTKRSRRCRASYSGLWKRQLVLDRSRWEDVGYEGWRRSREAAILASDWRSRALLQPKRAGRGRRCGGDRRTSDVVERIDKVQHCSMAPFWRWSAGAGHIPRLMAGPLESNLTLANSGCKYRSLGRWYAFLVSPSHIHVLKALKTP